MNVSPVSVACNHTVTVIINDRWHDLFEKCGCAHFRNCSLHTLIRSCHKPTLDPPPGTTGNTQTICIHIFTLTQKIQSAHCIPNLYSSRCITPAVPMPPPHPVTTMVFSKYFSLV